MKNLLCLFNIHKSSLQHLLDVYKRQDALYALSEISSENGYTRPHFHSEHAIFMEEARHPILDRSMKQTRYVSNNLDMSEEHDILMITGPNMGGKSTYMRQTALIVVKMCIRDRHSTLKNRA